MPVWLLQDESRSGNRLLESAQWHALWVAQKCTAQHLMESDSSMVPSVKMTPSATYIYRPSKTEPTFHGPTLSPIESRQTQLELIRVGQCSRSGGVSQELSFSSLLAPFPTNMSVCVFAHHLPRLAKRYYKSADKQCNPNLSCDQWWLEWYRKEKAVASQSNLLRQLAQINLACDLQ